MRLSLERTVLIMEVNNLRLAYKTFWKKKKKKNNLLCLNSLLLVKMLNINFQIIFHYGPISLCSNVWNLYK